MVFQSSSLRFCFGVVDVDGGGGGGGNVTDRRFVLLWSVHPSRPHHPHPGFPMFSNIRCCFLERFHVPNQTKDSGIDNTLCV